MGLVLLADSAAWKARRGCSRLTVNVLPGRENGGILIFALLLQWSVTLQWQWRWRCRCVGRDGRSRSWGDFLGGEGKGRDLG